MTDKIDIVDKLGNLVHISTTGDMDEAREEIERLRGNLEKLEAENEKLKNILRKAFPEKSGHFFICGEAGEKDSMGLPEKIMVCPAYGLDGFASYKKDRDYSAPGWCLYVNYPQRLLASVGLQCRSVSPSAPWQLTCQFSVY